MKETIQNDTKLVLGDDDDPTFKKITGDTQTETSSNTVSSFAYFKDRLNKDGDPDLIWNGLQGLKVASLNLGTDDDAQAIFESMNSTGLDLSTTDLVRNYMLMGGDLKKQEKMYRDYWRPMEKMFEDSNEELDSFFQCYIVMKLEEFTTKDKAYEQFKKYMHNRDRHKEIEEIFKHSKLFLDLTDTKHDSGHLFAREIEYVNMQENNAANPLLLKVLMDYANKMISETDVKNIFLLVGSYLLRCYVCGALRAADLRFPRLIHKVDTKRYARGLEELLVTQKGAGKFPSDTTFKEALMQLRLYNNRTNCSYILGELERERSKETVDLDNLTIEHIMPKKLTDEWETTLGETPQEVHEKYCNMIGNLTLTAYNSELSNKSFHNKLPIYEKSNIAITRSIAEQFDEWHESSMCKRADEMTNKAVLLWKYPEGYDNFQQSTDNADEDDSFLEEEHLAGKNTTRLWNAVKERIQSACPKTIFVMHKRYGSFRLAAGHSKNDLICSIMSRKNKIHVAYNTSAREGILTPSDFLKDVSGVRMDQYGDLRATISLENDIDKVVNLAKDVWSARLRA